MNTRPLLILPLAASAQATTLDLEIPRLDVAEYHNPYIAAWIEDGDRDHVRDLTVIYDTELRHDRGEEWLKDIRQWWRHSGRSLDLPVEGLSRPTLPPGEHDIDVSALLEGLPAGEYTLRVEAAREVGGRELVELPFVWDGRAVEPASVQGESELGHVAIHS